MRTFAEWVEENHPDDEVLNEFLGKAAKWAANSNWGRAALLAGSVAFAPTAKAAAPMPSGSDPSIVRHSGRHSPMPFDKNHLVRIAPEMGLDPELIKRSDDYTAWKMMMRKVKNHVEDVKRNRRALARGAMVAPKDLGEYDWFGDLGRHYNKGEEDPSKWLPPMAPEQYVGHINGGIAGGGR